jgi:hypothetical protein
MHVHVCAVLVGHIYLCTPSRLVSLDSDRSNILWEVLVPALGLTPSPNPRSSPSWGPGIAARGLTFLINKGDLPHQLRRGVQERVDEAGHGVVACDKLRMVKCDYGTLRFPALEPARRV